MARFSSRLPEPLWIVVGLVGMGVAGILYGLSTSIPLAIVLVMITGFFNSPSSVARSVLLQRHTPREMRGRVFSAFYVMRDIIFLIGMAGAGLADVVDIRLLIVVASCLLFVSAAFTLVAPGLGLASHPRGRAPGCANRKAPRSSTDTPFRPATVAGLRPHRQPASRPSRGLADDQRQAFLRDARIRDVPAGTRVVEHGDVAISAYFILDGAGHGRDPGGGRLSRPLDHGRRRLLRGDRGADRAAHGRPTSSPTRT